MTTTAYDLTSLIYETQAVSIWNSETGPVYWYAASVPGPFYVNTELLIGPTTAQSLLDKITSIVADVPDARTRVEQLNHCILSTYQTTPSYQLVIQALAAKIQAELTPDHYDLISGGERRDWLFSIPLAHELKIRHLFLFKNQSFFCAQPIAPQEKALHVADLINNAASYFDSWFPLLNKAHLTCAGTLCVNTRGHHGLKKLSEHGIKVIALNKIDESFFKSSHDKGLISPKVVQEIELYFKSPQKWAEQYLLDRPAIFDVAHIDKKSFERLQNFFQKDPWQLRGHFQKFFALMDQAIQDRLAATNS